MAKIEIIFPSANIIPGNINHNDLSGLEGLGPEYIHLNQEEYNNLTIKPDLQSVLEEGSTASIETNFSIRTFDDYDYGTKFRLLGDGDTFSKVDLGLNTSNGNVSLNVDSSGITDSISLNHNNANGDKSITIDEVSMKITDTNKELGLVYNEDYTTNQLSNDRAITDVGGVKALITQGTSSLVTGVKGDAEATYRIGQVNITANNIGLGNVNNTSDLNKPISNATQLALDNTVKKTGESSQSIAGNITILGNIQSGGNITSSSNIIAAGNISTSINPTLDDHTTRKGYVDSKVVQTITSGITVSAPSQNAVYNALQLKADITYVDGLVSTAIRDAGNWDASSNTFPTTGTGTGGSIRRGDLYRVSVAGNPFGTEESLDVGDSFRALIANPGQTTSNWAKLEANTAQATESFRGTSFLLTSTGTRIDGAMTQLATTTALNNKQDTLLSGTNIKTVGGQSLVGAGNITEVQNSMTTSTILAPSVTAVNSALGLKANLASPALTGIPTAPTAIAGTNTTQLATTGFVTNAITPYINAIVQNGNSFGTTMVIGTNDANSLVLERNNIQKVIIGESSVIFNDGIISGPSSGGQISFGSGSAPLIVSRNTSDAIDVFEIQNVSSGSTGNIVVFSSYSPSYSIKAGVRKDGRIFGSDATANNDFTSLQQLNARIQNNLTGSTVNAPSVTAVNNGLALKANDADVIHKTGNESRTGMFTNNGEVVIGNTITTGSYYISIFPSPSVPANIQGVQANVGITDITLQSAGGNVGIGTSTVSEKLVVNGNVKIIGVGNGYIQPSPNGTLWKIQISDTGVISTVTV